jgi:hypothetical protein
MLWCMTANVTFAWWLATFSALHALFEQFDLTFHSVVEKKLKRIRKNLKDGNMGIKVDYNSVGCENPWGHPHHQHAHAPTKDSEKKAKYKFSEQLERMYSACPKHDVKLEIERKTHRNEKLRVFAIEAINRDFQLFNGSFGWNRRNFRVSLKKPVVPFLLKIINFIRNFVFIQRNFSGVV